MVYLSKIACINVGILSLDFPLPSFSIIGSEEEVNSLNPNAIPFTPIPNHVPCSILPKETVLPSRPQTLPFPPLPENVPKLKQWLLDSFSDTAFRDDSFPTMTGPLHTSISRRVLSLGLDAPQYQYLISLRKL